MGISFDHFNPLEKALKSLCVAKAENQPFVTYSEFVNTLALESEEKVEQLLKNAIDHEHILLFFQGVFDAAGTIFYDELLIRLESHEGLQSPKLFLKIARDRHMYDLLLTQIVQKVIAFSCTQMVPVALNLSSFDLLSEARIAFLKESFEHTSVILEVQCEDKEHISLLQNVLPRFKEEVIAIALETMSMHPNS
jgi:EAL domain-containing protein (putative c-di-GMP-specific phosphodiesterase class I)